MRGRKNGESTGMSGVEHFWDELESECNIKLPGIYKMTLRLLAMENMRPEMVISFNQARVHLLSLTDINNVCWI